jgi:hypothetical protein
MSGRIIVGMVDLAAFSFEFACLRCVLERSFLVETGAVRDTGVAGQRDVDRANCTVKVVVTSGRGSKRPEKTASFRGTRG